MVKLDYCIIKGGDKAPVYVIYVTHHNEFMLDPGIVQNEHFAEIKNILESQGFDHLGKMTFRSKNGVAPKIRSLNTTLKKDGFERNKEFEELIKEELELSSKMHEDQKNVSYLQELLSTTTHTGIPTFSSDIVKVNQGMVNLALPSNKRKSKPTDVVKVGEKLELHVYLFLCTYPTPDKSIDFDFEFDIFSRSNSRTRRFVKTLPCTFIRKENDTEDIMYLESEQTLGDILKELEFMFSIQLLDPDDLQMGKKPQVVTYNAIELKDYLDLGKKMTLHVDIASHYDNVLHLSNTIMMEKKIRDKSLKIPLYLVKDAIHDILERMEQRMHHYSMQEDYELAASYKRSISYISNKIELVKFLEEQGKDILNGEEYEANFTMRDLNF